MTTEPTHTLREVAILLGKIKHLPNGRKDILGLHALLKAGELKAGFEFPGNKVYWISIPTSYWTGVTTYKFDSLRYKSGDKFKIGAYAVGIGDFVDEYMEVVSQEIRERTGSMDTLLNELKRALSGAQKRYEVAITDEEWREYLKRNQIAAPALGKKSPAGRREKTSWHHLVPIIAAYVMTLDKRPGESPDHLYIATRVHELASKEGIPDLPAVDTIRDVISKAFAQAEKLSRA